MMENPLDLKLLMNQSIKAYKCETCNTTYTDKELFESHKLSHLKEEVLLPYDAKDQIPSVQIVMSSGNQLQIHPHSASTGHQIQAATNQMSGSISEQELAMYKPQQVYTLAPMSHYQVISTNNRAINVSASSQDNQIAGILPSFGGTTYVVAATPDGQHQLQPLTEIIQHEAISLPQEVQAQQVVVSIPSYQPNSRMSRVASTKDRPFKCDQCTASFIESQELEDHRKKHTGDGPFTCEDCHFTFMYKSHYKSHKTRCLKKRASVSKPVVVSTSPFKRHFPTNQLKQEQRQVISTFVNKTKVASPPLMVNSNRNPIRQVSLKQAAPSKFNPNKPSFKRAKRESRFDRPFECDECDASFQQEADLKTHRSKHTGEEPFKCDECKFVFLYRKLFEAHKRRCDKKKTDSSPQQQQPQPVAPQQQFVMASSQPNRSSYTNPPQTSDVTLQQTSVQPQMQLIDPSLVEIRPVTTDGGQEIPQHTILEQVIVGPGTNGAGRQEYKYEIIPSGIDGVNQIINLIKVKETQ